MNPLLSLVNALIDARILEGLEIMMIEISTYLKEQINLVVQVLASPLFE